jgi:regulator of cell morphogenesis and NO signaling
MTSTTPRDALELIEYVLERFHETHRRELPEILGLARALEAAVGPADGLNELAELAELTKQLKTMGNALEEHMFKEEMRLFPMMEQGGNSLIGHLIDDMHAEHLSHRDEIARIELRLSRLAVPAGAESELLALRAAVAQLFDDLAQHIDVEDDVLFPMFVSLKPT